jgi:hypothetical protein
MGYSAAEILGRGMVRKIDYGLGDVAGDVRIAAARIDHDDHGKAGLEIHGQIDEAVWKRSLPSIAVAVSPGSGAPNSLRSCRMRHG